MKCTKNIVLTGYRVQFVDLRDPKPRTPQEDIYVVDQQWHEAMGFLGLNVRDAIVKRYEYGGFHAFSVEQIKPKCVVELDLKQLYENQTAQVRMEQLQAFGKAHTDAQPDNQECNTNE